MRINDLVTRYISSDFQTKDFKENSMFKGKIIKIEGDLIFLELASKEVLEAKSTLDLKGLLGESINFLVTDLKEGSMVEIKPLINLPSLDVENEVDDIISNIFKEMKIEDNQFSRELIKTMVKYQVPLKKDLILEAVKNLDKLIQLSQVEDENLVFIEPFDNKENQDMKEEDSIDEKQGQISSNNLKESSSKKEVIKETVKLLLDESVDLKKEVTKDMKNIIIEDLETDTNNINKEVKQFLKGLDILTNKEEFLEIISFISKGNMEFSLNNVKNLREFLASPIDFFKDFRDIEEFEIPKDKLENLSILNNTLKKLQLKREGLETNKEARKISKEIEKILSEVSKVTGKKLDLPELKSKLEFIKEMNQEMYFHFIPINYGKEYLDGLINIIKKGKRGVTKDKGINIYINLETKNLSRVKVACNVVDSNIVLKLGIKEDDIGLFKMGEKVLRERVSKLAYEIERIEYIFDKEISIKEDLMTEDISMYFLDIKV